MTASTTPAATSLRTLVLGMGVTGAACARYLAAAGAGAAFADSRPAPPALPAIRALLPAAELITGGIPVVLPAGIQRVVVSPGVPLDLPLLRVARDRGVPVLSDIDLFAREATAPVIGITGSNGKSTATTMVGQLLARAGTAVGGNLGTAALDLLAPGVRTYVLELSSFQLERSEPLHLAAATILNITPDHLDLHGDFARYAAAKARIWQAADVLVVNRAAPETQGFIPDGAAVVGFGLDAPASTGDFGLLERGGSTWLARGSTPLLPAAAIPMAGRHNLANALAALALVQAAGHDAAALAPLLRDYQPLGHRMAVIPTADGLTWIDDSKATNVGAAEASIRSVEGRITLVAGGDAKGATFETLAAALAGRADAAILLGRDAGLLEAALAGACPIHRVASMAEAVAVARRVAGPGSTVLLAPACSSLDMFRDYADRGTQFRAAVLATLPAATRSAGGGRP